MENLKCLSLAIVLLLLKTSTVFAENRADSKSAPGLSADQLDTISVTANRDQEASLDVPASIGVVDQASIELDQPNYQKDLFNSIAGVRVTQTGSTLGHITSIRMPANTGPYYLFLQDGIPVQSSGFFNHNGLAYTNFSSAGSAEVLKGAGSALYGSDSVAGTINVISNDPSLKDGISAKLDSGSDGFYKLGVAGGINTGDNASGFALSHSESDGWRDHTASERTEASLTHFASLNDDNTLKTSLSFNATEAEMAGSLIGLDELKTNPESVGDIQAAVDSGLEVKRKFDFARLSTEWTHLMNDEISLSTIGYVRTNRNRYVATWEKNLPQNDSQEKSLGILFKADIDQGDIRWALGTDIEITRANRSYQQLFDYIPSSFGAPVPAGTIYDYDVDYQAISPYVSSEFDLSSALKLNAGLRYDTSQFDYENKLADGQYASSSYARPGSHNDPSFEHLSPKFSLTYRFDQTQNVYARFANSFRIPQASRLYSLKTNNINFELDPEISDTFEIGYKLATQSHRLDTAIYFMSIDDSIVSRENSAGDRYFVNGGETQHRGVEIAWLNRVNDEFSTRLAYSHSKHKFVNDAVYGDNEQAAAPSDTANLRFILSPHSVPGMRAVVEFEHVGRYWLDDANTETYAGYTIMHLKTNYQLNSQLKLTAKINNIADKVYAENASLSYGKEKYTPGSPRQFFASLEYGF